MYTSTLMGWTEWSSCGQAVIQAAGGSEGKGQGELLVYGLVCGEGDCNSDSDSANLALYRRE